MHILTSARRASSASPLPSDTAVLKPDQLLKSAHRPTPMRRGPPIKTWRAPLRSSSGQTLPGPLSAGAPANCVLAVKGYADAPGYSQAATIPSTDHSSGATANGVRSFKAAPIKGETKALLANQIGPHRRQSNRNAPLDLVHVFVKVIQLVEDVASVC